MTLSLELGVLLQCLHVVRVIPENKHVGLLHLMRTLTFAIIIDTHAANITQMQYSLGIDFNTC